MDIGGEVLLPHVRNQPKRSLQEHRDIVVAIESGNEEKAEALLKNHVSVQGDRFTDFFASMSTQAVT